MFMLNVNDFAQFQSRKYRELTTKFHDYEDVNDFIYTYHT